MRTASYFAFGTAILPSARNNVEAVKVIQSRVMPPPQCSLPEFGGRPFDRHKFAFVIPASFGRQLGSGLAEKDRSRRNADRHGQKVQQGKADQSQADQSKPGARRKVATDEAQLGPKGQPPPFEWRIEKNPGRPE